MAPSTSTVSDKDVVACIKKGLTIPKAATELKVSSGIMASLYYRLEPIADPSLKIEGTPKAVAKGIVDGRSDGLRWERLAARTGKSVSEVKAVFETATGTKADKSYSGRGRHFDTNPAEKKAPAKKAAATKAPAKKAAKGAPARTRAERLAKGSPS